MYTPSARTAAEIQKPYTEPIFLIELQFQTTVYLSTRGPTLWNFINWEQAQVQMGNIQYGDNGEYGASLRLPPAYMSEALFPGIINRTVSIGQLWGVEPFAIEDLVFLIEGAISDVKLAAEWIDIAIAQPQVQGLKSPRYTYDHQNLQPAGTRVTINTRTIEIQRGDYY